jgi:hypothetical protein
MDGAYPNPMDQGRWGIPETDEKNGRKIKQDYLEEDEQ